MQAVINLSDLEGSHKLDLAVCGVPLLKRIILTAVRSGCKNIVVVRPPALPAEAVQQRLDNSVCEAANIRIVEVSSCDIAQPEYWRQIESHLEDHFVWLPWHFVPHTRALAVLIANAGEHPESDVTFESPTSQGPGGSILDRPAVFLKSEVLAPLRRPLHKVALQTAAGAQVRAASDIRDAEKELVRHSGKPGDGIYSRFNRALCRPAVRWLCHTSVTPNAVTYVGIVVGVLAGLYFAKGTWSSDVAGGLLFFLCGLIDEMDGMLARVTFRESPYGCWLETMADYASYLLVFAGMTIGAYHRHGSQFLVIGIALLTGCVLSFVTISIQRRLAAPAGKPNEYSQRYLRALERDSANPISRAIRTLQFLLRKGVLIHYVLLFSLLGLVPVILALGAFGANVAWMVTIYFNARLFHHPGQPALAEPNKSV